MREIKFRAWARFDKVMLSNSDIWFKTNVQGYELFCDTPDNKDSWILMQYTGLKDKNGVEIYEGDIVLSKNTFETKKAKIVFLQGSFMCEWLNDDCYSEEMSRLIWNHRPYSGSGEMFEVIGNIYENPELLQ